MHSTSPQRLNEHTQCKLSHWNVLSLPGISTTTLFWNSDRLLILSPVSTPLHRHLHPPPLVVQCTHLLKLDYPSPRLFLPPYHPLPLPTIQLLLCISSLIQPNNHQQSLHRHLTVSNGSRKFLQTSASNPPSNAGSVTYSGTVSRTKKSTISSDTISQPRISSHFISVTRSSFVCGNASNHCWGMSHLLDAEVETKECMLLFGPQVRLR